MRFIKIFRNLNNMLIFEAYELSFQTKPSLAQSDDER